MIYKLNGNGVMAYQYSGADRLKDAPDWIRYYLEENALSVKESRMFYGTAEIAYSSYIVRLPNNKITVLSKEQFETLFVESEELSLNNVSVNFSGKLSKDIHSELLKLPAECYLNVYHKMQSEVFGGYSYSGCGGGI